MVPIHLDALYLENGQSFVEAMANFSRMPYSDGTQDVNPNIANISADIVSQPFQNRNLYLKAGIYLHWALPDALTKGSHSETGMTFPRVPNRWLVTRTAAQQKKQWVVESDYLFPYPNVGESNIPGSQTAVCIPYNPEYAYQKKHPPFRYMGRKVPFTSSWNEDSQADHVRKLTALGYEDQGFGYAEPTFAAFFPNCHSVFGFYDDEYSGNLKDLQYEIIGWYSDPSQDYLHTFIKELSNQEEILAAIKEELKWTTPDSAVPEQMLCYARLTFKPSSESTKNPAHSDPNTTISVDNTGTEALSAYLANHINSNKQSIIEDQLEAIQLSAQLEHRQLDIGPKFKEARHTKGFTATAGGVLWSIRPITSSTEMVQVTLPDSIADLLNSLNLAQQTYDKGLYEIESLRKQLFADWYKYMICAYPPFIERPQDYPDIDEVKYYIEQQDIAILQNKIAELGELVWQKDSNDNVIGASISQASSPDSKAAQLIKTINQVTTAINNHNQSATDGQIKYALQPTASMRYWQPNDPVVLMTGDAVKPTTRHGQDGLLACQIFQSSSQKPIPDQFEAIRQQINKISNADNFAFSTWAQQAWHPFLLEWEVEVFPIKNQSNLSSPDKKYQTDFITSNYELAETKVEMTIREGQSGTIQGANIYSGRSILTPYAGIQLKKQIEAYLKSPQTDQSSDLTIKAKKAQSLLENLNCLSQSLGGFNEALLMHQQIQQLNIADPLGFKEYKPFTETVSQLVNKSGISAPQPLNDFNPIRSGSMRVLQLRLVDTFGQLKDLDCRHIMTTETMTDQIDTSLVWLPPRLVQPARLNFRWLSANHPAEVETNAHPATTPICGWILPNNLDNSLMIYNAQGQALGSINQLAKWQQVPGSKTRKDINSIKNLHLRKVVKYITNQDQNFLAAFISTLDSALENIEPENFAQHESLALLMGRPIAVVRASVKLELQGLPAVNVGWNVFRQDMQRTTKEIDAFTSVQFPIRIGEYKQLNDGLVGYWKEQGDDYENNIFYAPQSDPSPKPEKIKSYSADPLNINQSVESPAQILTILMDPRGKIHATSGILPTKEISIPPDQYTAALQAINITFLTTPILTSKQKLSLPLPTEPGYQWSWVWAWVENEDRNWSDTSQIAPINPNAVFSAEQQEVREGWLQLSKEKEKAKN